MSENKQQQYGENNHESAVNVTVCKDKNLKHRPKNVKWFDEDVIAINADETEVVEVVRVIREDHDSSSALMDIEVILSSFKRVPILFCSGELFINLNYDKLLFSDMLSSIYTKTIPLRELADICNLYQTFVAVGLDGNRLRVIPKHSMTYHLFDKLGILEKCVSSKVSVQFKDLLPIYYKTKLRKRRNISTYTAVGKQQKHKFELSEKCHMIQSMSLRKCNRRNSVNNQPKFGKVLCPRIRNRLNIFKQYPVEDEEYKFPIQATSDDLDNDFYQQVPSEFTPSLVTFDYTLPPQNSSSQMLNFRPHNYMSGQTNLQTDLLRQPTDFQTNEPFRWMGNFHFNGSSSQPTDAHTNNSTRQPPNFQVPSHLTNSPTNDSTVATLNRPRVPPRYERYVTDMERAASYAGWPHQRPTPTQLSNAGFFFTNDGDLVRCFQCGIGLKDFSEEDDPLLEHVRHSGKCPFLPEFLSEERLSDIRRYLRQTDPEFYRRMQVNGEINPDELSSYRHPEYRTMESRLSTFTNWPRNMIQTPQQLAEAGLYYIGFEDHVRCFACDGGLRRWDPEDDPWTEHCRWFPACPFAIEQKGEQFIALIQASVENERFEASGGGDGNDDMIGAMARLRIRESETETVIKQHVPICHDMGFEDMELKGAVLELYDRGNKTPSIEDIVDVIEVIRDRKMVDTNIETIASAESPLEENRRLKNHVFCMMCEKNNINALFLPCTHHRVCMSCAEPLESCPICRRIIKEKIRTYMV